MVSAPRPRERLLLPLLVAAVAVGGLLWVIRGEHETARRRVEYEDLALSQVRTLAAAEKALHERTGRYGWLSDLQRAGLLEGTPLQAEDADVRGAFVPSPRYRIDILLPFSVLPGDMVQIAPCEAGHENPELERLHFVVVARPWGDALTGFRTFYLDESGHVYLSEGVSDVESRRRRPLPELHLTRGLTRESGDLQAARGIPREVAILRWYRLDGLPKR